MGGNDLKCTSTTKTASCGCLYFRPAYRKYVAKRGGQDVCAVEKPFEVRSPLKAFEMTLYPGGYDPWKFTLTSNLKFFGPWSTQDYVIRKEGEVVGNVRKRYEGWWIFGSRKTNYTVYLTS